jgi:DNA-binding CsgD family transcriptional regulator
MSHSARLRLQDLRTVYQLISECRELGDDPVLWRQHLFARLALLTGAGVVMGGEVKVEGEQTSYLGLTDWGWENGFNRLGWERAMSEMAADPSLSRTPAVATYLARRATDDGTCLSRVDLIPNADWYRSWDYENLHRACEVDHTLWCFRSVAGTANELNGLLMSRSHGERDFTARQKAVVREAHSLLAPLVGGPLSRFTEPSPTDLSLRLRQVLRGLLEGDADKQLATRLGLSRHTVNEYVDRVLRHFGVTSRAELLARWVRRGWGGRFAWIDESP